MLTRVHRLMIEMARLGVLRATVSKEGAMKYLDHQLMTRQLPFQRFATSGNLKG